MRAKIFIIGAVIAAGIGYLIFSLSQSNQNKKYEFKMPDQIAQEKSDQKGREKIIRVVASSSGQFIKSTKEVSENLSTIFGKGISVQFTVDGQFESVTGNFGLGLMAVKDFSPRNEKVVRARAKVVMAEILKFSRFNQSENMNEGLVTVGDRSAQVYFQQSHDGVPLEPAGRFTVDLGPQGELLGAHSDLVSQYEVSGSFQSSAPSAQSSKVYWIDTSATPPKAIAAYQTYEKGKQIITDASTGQILFQRDRRHF